MARYKLFMRSFAPWTTFGAVTEPKTVFVPALPPRPNAYYPVMPAGTSVTFGGGFHGDGRGFSLDTKPSVTSRINAYLEVDLASATAGASKAWCDTSRGPWMGIGPDSTATGRPASTFTVRRAPGSPAVEAVIEYSASNPLVTGSPDIDARGEFTFRGADGKLTIDAVITGDQFPACESFVQDAAGHKVFLGGFAPSSKDEILRLYGRLNKPQEVWFESHLVVDVDAGGNFVRVVGGGNGSNSSGPASESLLQSLDQWNARIMQSILMPADAP